MTEQQEQYTEIEKEAQKWLDETDTMQFSQMELLTMFAAKKVKEYDLLHNVSKRYFLFGCINADKQKLKKLIIAPDRETAIADIETNYPYIEKWYSSEELNVC
jgi:hypothetical protein